MARRLGSIGLLTLALAACGTGKTTTTGQGSAASTHASAANSSPPAIDASQAYVTGLIPAYEAKLKARGADLFGKTTVQCAATGGRQVECLVEIPYRRLQSCAIAKGSVFVQNGSSGLEQSQRPGNGDLSLYQQICYIGPNGDPVPSKP